MLQPCTFLSAPAGRVPRWLGILSAMLPPPRNTKRAASWRLTPGWGRHGNTTSVAASAVRIIRAWNYNSVRACRQRPMVFNSHRLGKRTFSISRIGTCRISLETWALKRIAESTFLKVLSRHNLVQRDAVSTHVPALAASIVLVIDLALQRAGALCFGHWKYPLSKSCRGSEPRCAWVVGIPFGGME